MLKILYLFTVLFALTVSAENKQIKLISNPPVKSVSLGFAGDGGSVGILLLDSKKIEYSFTIDGGLGSQTKGKVFLNEKGKRRILNQFETVAFKNLLIKLKKQNVSNCRREIIQAIQTIK